LHERLSVKFNWAGKVVLAVDVDNSEMLLLGGCCFANMVLVYKPKHFYLGGKKLQLRRNLV
jgi:hypothetical protein